jgi:hypothetical protein
MIDQYLCNDVSVDRGRGYSIALTGPAVVRAVGAHSEVYRVARVVEVQFLPLQHGLAPDCPIDALVCRTRGAAADHR